VIKIKPETVELIEELLPFSVLLTSDKTIAGVGQTLRRRYGHVQVGGMFSDYFEILNPRASGSAIEPVEQDGPRFLMIRLREKGLRLRGSARRMGPNSILLELSPAISSEAELGKAGLSYDDLPLHDNTLDLLISLRAHRDALNQAKALTDELDTQNAAIALAHRELVDLLEQERVAAQFRNRVLGMLSHELRTSLAQVMSVGELLRRGIKTIRRRCCGSTELRSRARLLRLLRRLRG
jgi:signal transduction histidine kinase